MGQFVDEMAAAGLVVSQGTASDRRVRIVRRTPRGAAQAERAGRLIDSVEAVLRAQVGARRYDAMKAVLREIGAGQFD
jgi:DNA-binding MarR family transcriptional regulator